LILSKKLVERPKSDDSISVLMENVNTLLSGINTLMPKAEAAANGIANGENSSEVGRIMTGLASSIESLNAVLENVAEMTEDPTGLAVKLLDPKGSIKTLLDDDNRLYNQISGIIENLGKTLKDVEELTTFISEKRPDLAIMLQDTQRAIKQGNDVLQGLSNNPLISGGITKEQPQTGSTQGNRDENF
jgi:ABC-type transporter Mla subunit MlaD